MINESIATMTCGVFRYVKESCVIMKIICHST
ncbi:hypothetical protein J608_6033, partial [Acinetobacter baumannii 1288284]